MPAARRTPRSSSRVSWWPRCKARKSAAWLRRKVALSSPNLNAISANGLRRKPVFERRYAKELRCAERNADEIGPGFAMLEAIGQHAERESLGVGNRLIARGAIGQDALEVGDLGDPAAILFAVDFDGEVHADWGEGLVAGRASDALPQSSKEVLLSAERLLYSISKRRTLHSMLRLLSPDGRRTPHPATP